MRGRTLRRWSMLVAVLLATACAPRPGGAGADGSAPGTAAGAEPAAPAAAPTAVPPEKVTIAYSSVSGDFLPLWVTFEAGLFAKHGLDAEVTYIASGTTAMQSLLANEVQFVMSSAPESAAALVAGAPVRIVIAWNQGIAALFMVDASITRPEELRGKPVGISRFGGQPHVAARLALKKWGLDPDNDVQYVQLGGVAEILAAMQQGAVVGGVFSPPTNVRAQRLGFRVLGDLAQMGVPYQAGVLSSLQPYLEANPEATRRFVQGMLDAIKVSLTDDATTSAVLAKYTRTDDADLLNTTIDFYRQYVTRAPYPTLAGLQTVLDDLAESEPRARTLRPEQVVNTTALEQLDREGYLKQLYGE
jgi:NitT/TauT family transport system substrate-binding protein